jgi:hypothetical protein
MFQERWRLASGLEIESQKLAGKMPALPGIAAQKMNGKKRRYR